MDDITIHIEGTCPEEFAICMTDDEWYDFVNAYELDIMGETDLPQVGDAEAVTDFAWELAYIAIPMSVLAFYGLSIYAIFKYIQKRFS